MAHTIRDVNLSDLDAVLELNEAVIPAVNSLNIEKMRWFSEVATYFRVAWENERIGAFMIGLRAGVDYESINYRWFCDQYDDFGYVDRIAVAAHARRQGLASTLYDDFQATLPDSIDVITCEVNLRPPNETSMTYHEQMGFRQIGAQEIDNGKKEVALMAKIL